MVHSPWLGVIPSGQRIADPVTLRDLPRTMQDLAHLDGELTFPGTSLAQFWNPERDATEPVSASPVLSEVSRGIRIPEKCRNHAGAIKSIVFGDYHLIEHTDSRFGTELYDLQADPQELENLADRPDVDEIIQQCRRALTTIRP